MQVDFAITALLERTLMLRDTVARTAVQGLSTQSQARTPLLFACIALLDNTVLPRVDHHAGSAIPAQQPQQTGPLPATRTARKEVLDTWETARCAPQGIFLILRASLYALRVPLVPTPLLQERLFALSVERVTSATEPLAFVSLVQLERSP